MKPFLAILLVIGYLNTKAQPPGIQWSKCVGGSSGDYAVDIKTTIDGGFVVLGDTFSDDGDISGNHGAKDILVAKFNAAGNIQWLKCYGGSLNDNAASIIQTNDGGYLFGGATNSHDGDVFNNHGLGDGWIVKLDPQGIIQWSKTLGGTNDDYINNIILNTNGNYIISAATKSTDGDVTFNHGGYDAWILELDLTGNIVWQKTYGGSNTEQGHVIQTSDGGYLFAGQTLSNDGDVSGNHGDDDFWVFKINSTGIMQWQKCFGGSASEVATSVKQTSDGYLISGITFSNDGDVTGNHGGGDAWVIDIGATGNLVWENCFGGALNEGGPYLMKTADDGCIISGKSSSFNTPCTGFYDMWIVKIDPNGNQVWQSIFGGSNNDGASSMLTTPDGNYMVAGTTASLGGEIIGNHGGIDIWLLKLAFPAGGGSPGVTIAANTSTVCEGKNVTFIATSSNGGTNPFYQWKVNGVVVPVGNTDTVMIPIFNSSDIITCQITSSSACASMPATSNPLSITVDSNLSPYNFLPPDTSVCINGNSFGTIVLKPTRLFSSYLWNNGSTNSSITIIAPGNYSLKVTDGDGCIGKDTITVSTKMCRQYFYVPTAFSPNDDRLNDLFRPLIAGDIKHYHFTVYNRWGQSVFKSDEPGIGWDGKLKGLMQRQGIFAWVCSYQFVGDVAHTERGTFILLR